MNPHSTYANLSDEERAGLDARGAVKKATELVLRNDPPEKPYLIVHPDGDGLAVLALNAAHQIEPSWGYEEMNCSCGWQGTQQHGEPDEDGNREWIDQDWQDDHFLPLLLALFEYRAEPALTGIDLAAPGTTDKTYWLLFFEDPDHEIEMFSDEAAARARFAQVGSSWNATLFTQVESNFPAEP